MNGSVFLHTLPGSLNGMAAGTGTDGAWYVTSTCIGVMAGCANDMLLNHRHLVQPGLSAATAAPVLVRQNAHLLSTLFSPTKEVSHGCTPHDLDALF